ncbi:MAG: hypothetical protein M1827_004719 [Pycnora praestabilis]|nr:MAG: hypothetical protein M1827_004719 [Pycnora praestabilis]
MKDDDHLLICTACGTQYGTADTSKLQSCRVCDDPRQFVPPSGQSFTTLAEMREKFKNKWVQDTVDKRIWSIWTEPKFGIGQRAILLQTSKGNVLWDLIANLDTETIELIRSLGGLKAIVISHPHYYTTHIQWAKTFNCPVYISAEDQGWINRSEDYEVKRHFIKEGTEEVLDGVRAIKTGGHFDGSLVLHWNNKLFIADTFVTVPSGLYYVNRPPGTTSYSFMWSIPNMIPLPPSQMLQIWHALQPFGFTTTHGAFLGMDVRDPEVKGRILESMKIQVKSSGHSSHGLLKETWP